MLVRLLFAPIIDLSCEIMDIVCCKKERLWFHTLKQKQVSQAVLLVRLRKEVYRRGRTGREILRKIYCLGPWLSFWEKVWPALHENRLGVNISGNWETVSVVWWRGGVGAKGKRAREPGIGGLVLSLIPSTSVRYCQVPWSQQKKDELLFCRSHILG